jgi:NADPH2:quinone reductase
MSRYPLRFELELAGEVAAVGSKVTGFKVGDRAFTTGAASGTYAHHCLVNQNSLHRLPSSVSFDAGAALGTAGMAAYRGLFIRGGARPGDRVLVHGATGGVGVIAVQLAVAHGMTVVGTADDQEGVALVKKMGAAHAFIHLEAGYFEKVRACGPFDVIIECLANVRACALGCLPTHLII